MKKGIIETVLSFGTGIVIGVGVITATSFGIHSFVNNREYIDGNYHSISKANGLFGSVSFTKDKENYREDEITQEGGLLFEKTIINGGYYGEYDGLVDRISLRKYNKTSVLKRKRDYAEHKKEFDDADRTLAKTKEKVQKIFSKF